MTTDRELLELAAKAAGVVNYTFYDGAFQPKCLFIEEGSRRGDQGYYWSPLTDDGDALRLAVRLKMVIDTDFNGVANAGNHNISFNEPEYGFQEGRGQSDLQAATRRAIVRAAAEIGKAMK